MSPRCHAKAIRPAGAHKTAANHRSILPHSEISLLQVQIHQAEDDQRALHPRDAGDGGSHARLATSVEEYGAAVYPCSAISM